jgi:uncharacterized protein
MKPVLLDSGVIVALLNRNEPYHFKSAEAIAAIRNPFTTCEAVLAESCFVLRNIPGAMDEVLTNVARGIFELPFRLLNSAADVEAIMDKYRDSPADFADACIIQMADELDTGDIFTLDSDFRHYCWRKTKSFNLLIALA